MTRGRGLMSLQPWHLPSHPFRDEPYPPSRRSTDKPYVGIARRAESAAATSSSPRNCIWKSRE